MNIFLMKKSKFQLSSKLITVLVVGCSVSIIAAEGKIQNKQDSQTNESDIPVDVNAYLEKNAPKIKQELEKLLNQAIKDAEDTSPDEMW